MTSLLFRSGKYFKLRLETFVFPRVTSIHIHYQPVFSSGRNLSKGGEEKKNHPYFPKRLVELVKFQLKHPPLSPRRIQNLRSLAVVSKGPSFRRNGAKEKMARQR